MKSDAAMNGTYAEPLALAVVLVVSLSTGRLKEGLMRLQ